MAVEVRVFTDPACVWSWSFEPVVRALMVEFGEGLRWTFVMGGLAREYAPDAGYGGAGHAGMIEHWLDASAESGMPNDPRTWLSSPPRTTYPACMAVKAAQEQGPDLGRRCLRTLREGFLCSRRRLEASEDLVDAARASGLDADRFRVDLGSHAIVEAFGADLELAREVPQAAREVGRVGCSHAVGAERVPFPSLRFEGADGPARWTCGTRPLDFVRAQALAAGAVPAGDPRPGVREALERFGRMASVEVAAVCDLPLPRAEAELAQLALDWRVRPVPVLAGRLWELT